MSNNVRISIVTICFNNLADLQRTCASVDMQLQAPVEHIIVNGSTEKDIENWAKTTAQPAFRRFIHERDKGISDAFNKGIKAGEGDIVVLLNSGDAFAHELVTDHAAKPFVADKDLKWIHAKYQFMRGGIWVTLGKPFDARLLYRGMRAICHQTMFVKRSLYEQYGLYETDLKLAMDFDFLVRIRTERFLFVDEVMVVFAPDGASAVNVKKGLAENTRIIKNRLGFSFKHYLWRTRILFLATLLQSPFGKMLYKLKVKLKLENM